MNVRKIGNEKMFPHTGITICNVKGKGKVKVKVKIVFDIHMSVHRKYNTNLTFKRRIKSHLPFAGIIRNSPYSPRFQDNG